MPLGSMAMPVSYRGDDDPPTQENLLPLAYTSMLQMGERGSPLVLLWCQVFPAVERSGGLEAEPEPTHY